MPHKVELMLALVVGLGCIGGCSDAPSSETPVSEEAISGRYKSSGEGRQGVLVLQKNGEFVARQVPGWQASGQPVPFGSTWDGSGTWSLVRCDGLPPGKRDRIMLHFSIINGAPNTMRDALPYCRASERGIVVHIPIGDPDRGKEIVLQKEN